MKNPIATLHPLIKIALPAAAAAVGLAMYGGGTQSKRSPDSALASSGLRLLPGSSPFNKGI